MLSKLLLWDPSQKGLLSESPHLHREKASFVSILFPSPSTSSTFPDTRNEPLSLTLIVAIINHLFFKTFLPWGNNFKR